MQEYTASFVCGTTGEFVNLTLEERKRLLTAAVEGAGPESCILFNTTAMNLADMKELFDWARHEAPTRRRSPRPITTAMTPRL